MKKEWSEWTRTIVSVVLGFVLGIGWQIWRDYRQDSRDRTLAVSLLKARVGNDLFLTQSVVDGLRGKGSPSPKRLSRDVFFPQAQGSPSVGMALLPILVIQALDQYDKAVAGAERCRNTHVADSDVQVPEIAQERRLQVLVLCFNAFGGVARDFQTLLDREFPDVHIEKGLPLGSSGTWHVK